MINITVPTTSTKLKDLMTQEEWSKLISDVVQPYNLTIQNNGSEAVYIGRAGDVTPTTGYKLATLSEVEMKVKNPDDIRVISQTAENTQVIVITT